MRRRRLLGTLAAGGLAGCLRLTNQGGSGQAETGQDASPTTGRVTPDGDADRIPTVSGSWPQFGGGPRNVGVTAASGPTGEAAEAFRWETRRSTASSPVVADGRVYFTTNGSAELIALDAASGERAWSTAVEGLFEYAPAYADGTLFVGTADGTVYAVDAATGAFDWRADIGDGAFGPPAVDGDTLYISDVSGSVSALATDDGSRRWEASVDGVVLAGPAVADGGVYVPAVRPTDIDAYPEGLTNQDFFVAEPDTDAMERLFALDAAAASVHALSAGDGTERWTVEFPDFVVSTPAVADGTLYVGCWDSGLYALDADDGSRRWRHDLGAPTSASPSVADGTVYAGTWDGVIAAVGPDGTRRWFRPVPDGDIVTSKPCIAAGRVYVAVNDGPVLAVRTDGAIDWTFSGPGNDFDYSSPAVVDGVVYVCGDTGRRTVDGDEVDAGGVFALA